MSEGLRALFIDDSEDDVLLLVDELRRGGFDLVYKQVGTAEALSVALSQDDWDIVIADYSVPALDALSALELLRENGEALPFIVVSRAAGEDLAVEAMIAGADDYVRMDNLGRLVPAVRRAQNASLVRRPHRPPAAARPVSHAWYRSLVETSPDAIFVTDLKGEIIMANQRTVELRGCERVDDLLGRNVFEFLVPEDRKRALTDARQTVEAGRVRNLEYTMSREDGSLISVELSASVVDGFNGKPEMFLGVLRDITQRVEASEEIQQLKVFNEGIIHSMAEGIVVQDADGYLTFVNPAAATLLGHKREEMIGLHGTEITPADQHHIVEAADERRMTGQADRYELDLLHKDGTRIPVLVSGGPNYDPDTGRFVGTTAVFTDITDRKRTEEALRRRNRELDLLNRVSRALSVILDQEILLLTILDEVRRALGVAAASIWLIDPGTDELVCLEATGWQRETVRGWRLGPGEGIAGWVARHGESLIVPDTRRDPRHFKGVDQQIGLGVRCIMSVPMRARQDLIGVLQVVDTEVGRFTDSDLTLVEPLAATAAIAIENARLFAEEEQRAAELAYALEQQRELAHLKDQFIQNVSHELRTPLGLIQAYAQLLVDGELGELPPNQYEPISVIARRTQMLSKIVEDLTAIWETEAQKAQQDVVDFSDLVQQLLTDFQVAAEQAELSLNVKVQPDLPPILGDPIHLNQMLDNLLGNALKFTPPGGEIRVRLEQSGESLVLNVSDTGVGIPEDQLGRVFERFYQVDGSMSRRYGGAGLGLALVKDVVEGHGGQVNLESRVGEGSTFIVSLPVTAEREEIPEQRL